MIQSGTSRSWSGSYASLLGFPWASPALQPAHLSLIGSSMALCYTTQRFFWCRIVFASGQVFTCIFTLFWHQTLLFSLLLCRVHRDYFAFPLDYLFAFCFPDCKLILPLWGCALDAFDFFFPCFCTVSSFSHCGGAFWTRDFFFPLCLVFNWLLFSLSPFLMFAWLLHLSSFASCQIH